jgi:hypothetical protein
MVKPVLNTYTFKENDSRTICHKSLGEGWNRTAFQLSNVISVEIPEGVTYVPIFYMCTDLLRVNSNTDGECVIPNGVTSIDFNNFNTCTSLTTIIIPDSVTEISNEAFYGCTSLTNVTCLAETPPTLGTQVFDKTNNCPIYVPSASVNAYKAATNWSAYASRIQAIPTA